MEKIIVHVHGFSVLQQNFIRGDVTFLTKIFWGRGKKRLKNQALNSNFCYTNTTPFTTGNVQQMPCPVEDVSFMFLVF